MGKILAVAMPAQRIHISPTEADFNIDAADAILAKITAAIRDRGKCLIAFSGGETPRAVYRRLADLLAARPADAARMHCIFTDERMVPPDDPDSNYGMVRQAFIGRVAVPPDHVHRIRGEAGAEFSAREYEQELQAVLERFGGRCDLVLLGIGGDGHTASLFPGTDVLRERHKTVGAVFVPRLAIWRVTLTLPVLNSAREVMFLVSGVRKATIVREILSNTGAREDLPATLVRPHPGILAWRLDAKAASLVTPGDPSGRAATNKHSVIPDRKRSEEHDDE